MLDETGKDGRRARRSASRVKIVEALKELVREGQISPGAPDVAQRAGVGLRTVYRCFEDMEALYREMIAVLHEEFLPRVITCLDTTDRVTRLDQVTANRAELFSDMEPFLLASEHQRHVYDTLAGDYAFLVRIERDKLRELINPDGALEADTFEALNAVTGFVFWRRLRVEQGLSKPAAARIMSNTARAILAASTAVREVAL